METFLIGGFFVLFGITVIWFVLWFRSHGNGGSDSLLDELRSWGFDVAGHPEGHSIYVYNRVINLVRTSTRNETYHEGAGDRVGYLTFEVPDGRLNQKSQDELRELSSSSSATANRDSGCWELETEEPLSQDLWLEYETKATELLATPLPAIFSRADRVEDQVKLRRELNQTNPHKRP